MLGLLAGAATLAEEAAQAQFNLFPQQLQPPLPPSLPLRQKASKKKKRCGECPGCMMEEDCNVCKYCLDKPKLGGSNTLRRQCVQRVCANKEGGLDEEVSAYTQECLSQAIAHGKAIAASPDEGESEETEAIIDAAEAARVKGGPGAREPPSTDGLPPHPTGKRTYTKSAPGRPTHTTYQKAVMARFYELNKMPDAAEREALGKALGLTPRAVQVWFQNRRQRQKEAKEAAAPRGSGGGRPSSHDQQGTTTTTTWHQMYPEVAGGSASHSIRSPTNGLDQQQAVGIDLSQAFAPAGYKEAFGPTATASYLGPAQPQPQTQPQPHANAASSLPTDDVINPSQAPIGGTFFDPFGGGAANQAAGSGPQSSLMDAGYGNVLLEAYANLPHTSRNALPHHALKLVINAYMAMPLGLRTNLQPHVQAFVEEAMRRTDTRPPMGARDLLLRGANLGVDHLLAAQGGHQLQLPPPPPPQHHSLLLPPHQSPNDIALECEMRAAQELQRAQEIRAAQKLQEAQWQLINQPSSAASAAARATSPPPHEYHLPPGLPPMPQEGFFEEVDEESGGDDYEERSDLVASRTASTSNVTSIGGDSDQQDQGSEASLPME